MKHKSLLFVIVCLLACMLPAVGLLLFPTTKSTENKTMAAMPVIVTDEGKLNTSFFSEFESYFNEHMGLRNQLVFADAKIQTGIFQTSNVSGVIDGTGGWLYYSSTLDDYQGTSVLTNRELNNIAHNLSVVDQYLEEQGISFALTIPPNKNTLYGENMPYYDSVIVNEEHNAEKLGALLQNENVNYVDLFTLFAGRKETLYLKQDSHWNTRGALLAYSSLMDQLGLDSKKYSDYEFTPSADTDGDLSRMLYSFYGTGEATEVCNLEQTWTFGSEDASVEDGWVTTENDSVSGCLLMFRDSFANKLIPFCASDFQQAYFSKGQPHALERYLEQVSPDYVILEKVERNLSDYLDEPPIISPVQAELPQEIMIGDTLAYAEISVCQNDTAYYTFSGQTDNSVINDETELLVSVNGVVYQAYQTGKNGFLLYMKQSALTDEQAVVRVYAVTGNNCRQLCCLTLDIPNNK